MQVKDLKLVIKHFVKECLDELDLKSIIKETIQEMLVGTVVPSSSSTANVSEHTQTKKQSLFGRINEQATAALPARSNNPSKPYENNASDHELQSASFFAESMKHSYVGKQFGIKPNALEEALRHTAQTTLQEVKKNGSPISAMASRHVGGDRVAMPLEDMFESDVMDRWASVARLDEQEEVPKPKSQNKQQQKPSVKPVGKSSLRQRYEIDYSDYNNNDDE